jgi:mono/diheme cytochrome c family protein
LKAALIVVLLAAVPPLMVAVDRLKPSARPRVHPVPDMDRQPRLGSQAAFRLFSDRRAMRVPPAGTIARGHLDDDEHYFKGLVDGQFATTFPPRLKPITPEFMARGRDRFNIYCAPCHGLAGYGDGLISQVALQRDDSAGWVKPLSLHVDSVRSQPIGKTFNTISNGIRTMPSYASQIPVKDRWAIVLYVKALQRSQNATVDELPERLREKLQLREMK